MHSPQSSVTMSPRPGAYGAYGDNNGNGKFMAIPLY